MEFLYKYTSSYGAINILNSFTVKWSSPLEFNDPFDSQLNIGHWTKNIKEQILEEFKNGQVNNDQLLESLVDDWLQKNEKELDQSKLAWKKYVKWTRLFCLTENKDNLLMWAHYAESHKGAVFCFKIGESFNNPRKIIYSDTIPPVVLTVLDFAEDMSGTVVPFDYNNFFYENLFIKSNHWKYEDEWRCVSFIDQKEISKDKKFYEEYPIKSHEIFEIYLGCMMEEKQKTEIIDLATNKIENIRIYEARKHDRNFALSFHLIN